MSAISTAATAAIAGEVKIPVGHLWLTGQLIIPAGAVHGISLLQVCFVKQGRRYQRRTS